VNSVLARTAATLANLFATNIVRDEWNLLSLRLPLDSDKHIFDVGLGLLYEKPTPAGVNHIKGNSS